MPLCKPRLEYTSPPYPVWPEDWIEKKLQPIYQGTRHWTGEVPAGSIHFSCLPNKDGKIGKKHHASIRVAVQQIEAATRRYQSLVVFPDVEARNESGDDA